MTSLFFLIVLSVELICFPLLIYYEHGTRGVLMLIAFVLIMEILGFIFKERSQDGRETTKSNILPELPATG